MEKNKKDKKEDSKKNLDALFERLIQEAVEWEAKKDDLDENNPLDQELRDKQDANGEDGDN